MICTGAACFDCRDTAISWSTVPCYSSRGHPTNHSTGYPTKTSSMQQFHIIQLLVNTSSQLISITLVIKQSLFQNHLTQEYPCLIFLHIYSPDISVCYTLYFRNNMSDKISLRTKMHLLASSFQKQ